jgi:hypothetical protein
MLIITEQASLLTIGILAYFKKREKLMSTNNPNIGEVFTPPLWAEFAAQTSGIYQKWLAGATVLDPFMVEGALLLALVDLALAQGHQPSSIAVDRLYGFDWQADHIEHFGQELRKRGISAPLVNFFVVDTFFFEQPLPIDIIFTNPPWITFNHLGQARQEMLKPLFLQYNLVDTKAIIMGGSHVDLAALALSISLDRWPPRDHQLVSFIPHSLLTSAAHAPWRGFTWPSDLPLKPQWYYNLSNLQLFPISCDYGLLHLSATQSDPQYFKKSHRKSDWSVHPWPNDHFSHKPPPLAKRQRPRQGVNTSGANSLFIFETYQEDANHPELAFVTNNSSQVLLPKALLAPLLTADNFKSSSFVAKRWLFLPYHSQTGKLMPLQYIQKHYPHAYHYIMSIENQLSQRKGTMLRSYMKHGDFYALLGVGIYAFAPYKVVWQAMGSYRFRAMIVKGEVQGNQALHAYIPAYSKQEAKAIQNYLESSCVQRYFETFDVAGSKSFAQPHRVCQLFALTDESSQKTPTFALFDVP